MSTSRNFILPRASHPRQHASPSQPTGSSRFGVRFFFSGKVFFFFFELVTRLDLLLKEMGERKRNEVGLLEVRRILPRVRKGTLTPSLPSLPFALHSLTPLLPFTHHLHFSRTHVTFTPSPSLFRNSRDL